jgi:hypothetical protein
VQAAVLQLVEDLQPELGAFGLLDPQTQHFLATLNYLAPSEFAAKHRATADAPAAFQELV